MGDRFNPETPDFLQNKPKGQVDRVWKNTREAKNNEFTVKTKKPGIKVQDEYEVKITVPRCSYYTTTHGKQNIY